MGDITLKISQKIINLFDISIVVFEKRDNDIYYLYGNDYFKKHNSHKLQFNTFKTIFPEYNTSNITEIINTILDTANTVSIVENGFKLDIYSIDATYIVFCISGNVSKQHIDIARTKVLLNNMNHAIRTPLNGITGMVNLLIASNLDDDQYSYVQNIQNSCFILIKVITDLLDFLKLETNNMMLTLAPFNIHECIQSCVNMIQKKADNKGLIIHTIINPNVHKYVIGDISRIKQIILNILDNSLKFTEKGYIKIELYENPHLTIKITDSGIGLTEQETKEIFKILVSLPLFKNQQIGLGLPITKYLVDLMNGTITVDSQENIGTSFTITLPLKYYDFENKVERKNKIILILHSNPIQRINISKLFINQNFTPIMTSTIEEALMFMHDTKIDLIILDNEKYLDKFGNISKILLGKYTKAVRNPEVQILKESYDYDELKNLIVETLEVPIINKNYNILNVEDVEINRIINERMLDSLGFKKYKSVSNGVEAYDELVGRKYDILLLDIKLPHKNGLELLEDIKKNNIKMPYVIVMTAYMADELITECKTHKVNDILIKPIEIEHLQLALKKAQRFLA